MKTDPLFYRLCLELPGTFFELIGPPASEVEAYQFESVEVKQTSFRIDGLLTPKTKDPKLPLYFGEFQFYENDKIYANTFAEVFTYLNKNNAAQDWRVLVVYEKRSQEPTELTPYLPLLNSNKVVRVYLDEMDLEADRSLGIGIVQLIAISEAKAPEKAQQLLDRAKQELSDRQTQQNVLNLIETVVLYKFPSLSREELEAMLKTQDLRETKFAQEMLAEGERKAKLESVPRLLAMGLTVEQVAQGVGLTVEEVREIAEQTE